MRPIFLTPFTNSDETIPNPGEQKAKTLSYTIDWSPADQQFKAHCKKFPDISYLAGTREAALEGAKQEVACALAG